MTNSKAHVAVVGLGPMGQAMARAYLDHGYPVTVYNRTARRAESLVELGAVRADDPGAALDAADVVIISLTHYRAMYELLGPVADRLSGTVLVNLSSDTPAEAERAAAWAADHGAAFITGGIMVPAEQVGKPGAYTFYSGPEDVFERWRGTLEVLGAADYRGPGAGLALLWYQALLDVMMTTMTAVQHGAALVGSGGATAVSFHPYVLDLLAQMPYFMTGMAEEIDRREYPDPGASLEMMAVGMDHITEASRDAGIDTGLPAAVQSLYRRAVAAGHGRDGSTSIHEVIIKPE